ncbi:MAG: LCCL domain-containing protein [Polyangiales bacterium]
MQRYGLAIIFAISGLGGACKRESSNASPPPAAAPAPPAAVPIQWTDTATRYRAQAGAVLTLLCPPGGTARTVWGSDTYSDDSSICTAAAHSGRINLAQGGVVQIQIGPGQASYVGTIRGGVTTRHFGSFPGSFTIVGGATPGLVAVPVPRLNANGVNIGGVQINVGGGAAAGPWAANARSHRGQIGQSFTQECPPNGTFGTVWGSDVYTDDSSVCSAAVHAGQITQAQGGTVTAYIHPGRSRYPGVARNGVTSRVYAAYPGSFAFTPTVAPEAAPPPGVEAITWTTSATRFRATPGARQQVWCPPGGSAGSLWGSGPFTDDSSICTAAVFAGRITMERGGVVRLVTSAGLPAYQGGTRNGVTSRNYATFPGSLNIVR